jgi:hypothetical protein
MYGRAVACVFLAIAIVLAVLDVRAQTVVPPLSVTGPYPVACTNVEQDSARVPAGETAEMYWRGASTDSKKRYCDAYCPSFLALSAKYFVRRTAS